jgi:predicted DNA-binding transcriptional regulator AlpA
MSKQPSSQETQETQENELRFMPAKETERRAGASRWTLWRWEHDEEIKFPKSLRIGGKRLWIASEVEAWLAAKVAERVQ